MTPRVAGILTMLGAAALAIGAGWMLGHPPWSIPGAVVLVGAVIGFSLGSTWLIRPSWSDTTWPPHRPVDEASTRARLRRAVLLRAVLVPIVLAGSVFVLLSGENTIVGWLLLFVGIANTVGAIGISVIVKKGRASPPAVQSDAPDTAQHP